MKQSIGGGNHTLLAKTTAKSIRSINPSLIVYPLHRLASTPLMEHWKVKGETPAVREGRGKEIIPEVMGAHLVQLNFQFLAPQHYELLVNHRQDVALVALALSVRDYI